MLSVVIPTLNGALTISRTLSSIFSNDFPRELYEVIVVDNGSSDGTIEIAKKYPVRIIHCSTKGIGAPRNLGVRMATGEIVCFTDSDCVVSKDWLKKLSASFISFPEIDGVGGPVLPWLEGSNEIQRNAGQIFLEDHDFPKERTKVQFGKARGTLFGTNSAYRRETFLSVGGFERGGSSPELSWRLASKGQILIFDPSITVSHVFPWTLRSLVRQQYRWGMQMTQLRIKHKLFRYREIFLFIYFIAKRLLSLLSLKDLSKNLLRCVLRVAHFSGRVRGIKTVKHLK